MAFAPLPHPRAADGTFRKIGVEIEFIGLDAIAAAEVARRVLGGVLVSESPHRHKLHESSVGDIVIELDIWIAHGAAEDSPLEAKARELVGSAAGMVTPVEIIGPPVTVDALAGIDRLIPALREAGAQGTEAGLLFGFGTHFNVEVTGNGVADILPTLRAFALIEDWVREIRKPDFSRRVLPFIDPYPTSYRDLLAQEDYAPDMATLIDDYLTHNPTRNRSLDMLPLFTHLDDARVRAALGEKTKSGRPTYHYRLPDSRVGDPAWSLAGEWAAWVSIERVATDPVLVEALAAAWRAHRTEWSIGRSGWPEKVERILAPADVPAAGMTPPEPEYS